MPGLQITVKSEGPIFRGRGKAIVHKAAERTVEQAVNVGESHLHTLATFRPRGVFKTPGQAGRAASTGNYRRNIHGVRRNLLGHIHDNRVEYGPWLEGTGSRNKTTRFKGYHLWRQTNQMIQRKIPGMLKVHIKRAIKEIGG
jgi:hypothetical protein